MPYGKVQAHADGMQPVMRCASTKPPVHAMTPTCHLHIPLHRFHTPLTTHLLLCAAHTHTTPPENDGCKDAITGYSGTFGKRNAGAVDRFNNQTAQWKSKGAITVSAAPSSSSVSLHCLYCMPWCHAICLPQVLGGCF